IHWSDESRAYMRCDIRYQHDFAQWISRQPCAGRGPTRGVNPSLMMMWRRAANFAMHWRSLCRGTVAMSADALNSLFSLCIGFALAGALASGYQALVQRPAGFGLLQEGVAPMTFAAVPFLVFAAPFIIMRNTLRGARIERRRF